MIKHRNTFKRYTEMDINGVIKFQTPETDIEVAIDKFIDALEASNLGFGGGLDLEEGNLILGGGVLFPKPTFKDRGIAAFKDALTVAGMEFDGDIHFIGCEHYVYTAIKRKNKR